MKVTKAAAVSLSGAPDAKQLEKINRLTKREMKAEDVYVFSVRLCDDQVDRDDERFSAQCIQELAQLFIGKTGVMDHAWSAEKQVARIFDTEVLTENGVTFLKGWAYMLRGEETDGLIRQIEGGIKKEVSIGCAVRRRLCSICGEDYGACAHVKGEVYGTERCAAVLCDAADAYEFSFVAVPAQREAGVLKKQAGSGAIPDELAVKRLTKEAELGRAYRQELETRVKRAAMLLELELDDGLLTRIVRAMAAEDLRALSKGLERKTAELFAPEPQMKVEAETALEQNSAFLI